MLLGRIVATNGIQAPNLPLTMGILLILPKLVNVIFPFWSNVDYLYRQYVFTTTSLVHKQNDLN